MLPHRKRGNAISYSRINFIIEDLGVDCMQCHGDVAESRLSSDRGISNALNVMTAILPVTIAPFAIMMRKQYKYLPRRNMNICSTMNSTWGLMRSIAHCVMRG